jgi:hypothetical protein
MDKELDELTPMNLDGTPAETVHTPSKEVAEAAKAEEKEKKEDYYVDPLEQDALMKEKLKKIEEEKPVKNEEDEPEYDFKPDMNVSGYFSAGTTAKKAGFMSQTASVGALSFSFIGGITCATYSAFYLVLLISERFDVNWFLGWLYAVIAFVSIIILVNGIRSLKVQKENLKRKAMVGIVCSCISMIPLLAWIIHWIVATFLS